MRWNLLHMRDETSTVPSSKIGSDPTSQRAQSERLEALTNDNLPIPVVEPAHRGAMQLVRCRPSFVMLFWSN